MTFKVTGAGAAWALYCSSVPNGSLVFSSHKLTMAAERSDAALNKTSLRKEWWAWLVYAAGKKDPRGGVGQLVAHAAVISTSRNFF